MNSSDAFGKLILRLSLGILVLLHGIPKLMDPSKVEGIGGMLAPLGLPVEAGYAVYLGEIVAPIMIIIGLLTRVGGLLIAINMVVAVYLVHMGELMMLNPQTGGYALELQAMYLFGGLALFFTGSGYLAVRED